MLYPFGVKIDDFSKPIIGIASTWSNVTPCNTHERREDLILPIMLDVDIWSALAKLGDSTFRYSFRVVQVEAFQFR